MTSIAYREGILACDSAWGDTARVDTLASKICRLRSGALLGQAGTYDWRLFIELLNDVKTFRGLPKYNALADIRADALMLLILPNRTIVKVATVFTSPGNWTEDSDTGIGAWEITEDFSAVGSGAPLAIGAMEAGASARQAVRIACRRDLNSRLPVHTLQFPKK